jgi:5-methyltetrahydropteroyltriglutamate--homocysteine methyltransferase
MREAVTARGDPWEQLLDTYIDVINAVVRRVPAGMQLGMHLCRGNRMGHWQAAGGYDVVATKLFRDVDIDFFFLEYDSERAGSFAPLREVPAHKRVVLGLVSTKVAELEPADRLVARIDECARYIDKERLAISPQCGFSSSDGANTIMSHDQAVAKLARVIEVAKRVWG